MKTYNPKLTNDIFRALILNATAPNTQIIKHENTANKLQLLYYTMNYMHEYSEFLKLINEKVYSPYDSFNNFKRNFNPTAKGYDHWDNENDFYAPLTFIIFLDSLLRSREENARDLFNKIKLFLHSVNDYSAKDSYNLISLFSDHDGDAVHFQKIYKACLLEDAYGNTKINPTNPLIEILIPNINDYFNEDENVNEFSNNNPQLITFYDGIKGFDKLTGEDKRNITSFLNARSNILYTLLDKTINVMDWPTIIKGQTKIMNEYSLTYSAKIFNEMIEDYLKNSMPMEWSIELNKDKYHNMLAQDGYRKNSHEE